jgi:AraC-like DNA-binding protein
MKASTWNPSEISRRAFELSLQNPILAFSTRYVEKQDFNFDMHWELEFGVVRSGCMRRQYENFQMDVHKGGVWFCGMWEPHGYKVVTAPCEVEVLVILPQMLVKMQCDEAPDLNWLSPFSVPPDQRPVVPPPRRAEMVALSRRFAKSPSPVWRRVLLMEMLLLLNECWKKTPAANRLPATSYSRINKAVELVFANQRMLTAQEAARACQMSRNHFNRVFEELMGLSFARFALRYRLSSAAAQLLRTDLPVKSVAAEWGFTDASHLHHCFLKHYGCSPQVYRKTRQQNNR